MKDQQEAERKKMASQEIQKALEAQTQVIAEKQESVRNDLAKVEPAVLDAQQGMKCSVLIALMVVGQPLQVTIHPMLRDRCPVCL